MTPMFGAKILLRAEHRVARTRLGGASRRPGDAIGDRLEHADVQAVMKPAGELRGAEDRGNVRRCLVAVVAVELRRAPDAPRIEQSLAAAVHDAAVEPIVVEPSPLDEEGPPLLEEGLECTEVDDRRIRLDLAKIGIHGCVEREVWRDPVFDVGSRGQLLRAIPPVFECTLPTGCRNRRAFRDDVRHDLEPVERGDVANSFETPELRGDPALRLAKERPARPLLVALDVAPHGESEDVIR